MLLWNRFGVACLAAVGLLGCGGGGSGGASGPASIAGTIQFEDSDAGFPGLAGGASFDTSIELGRVGPSFRTRQRALSGLHSQSALLTEDSWLELRSSAAGALLVYDSVEGTLVAFAEGPQPSLRVRARGAVQWALQVDAPQTVLECRVSAADGSRRARGVEAIAIDPSQAQQRFATWLEPQRQILVGEAIVLAREESALESLLGQHGLTRVLSIPGEASLVRFAVSSALDPAAQARASWGKVRALVEDPRVLRSECNSLHRPLGGPLTPTDTFYPYQWHYPLIHLPQAWAITQGSVNTIVAILDTGETQHPDLDSRQIAGYDFISSVSIAADGDGLDPDPTDVGDGVGLQPSSFHGTHVAGTIGAESNNGQGVAGVTWATRLMHLRVLGQGGGSDFDIANAIRYAARLSNSSGTLPPERAQVINMSLGGGSFSSTMQSAITAARNAGVVLFAASGNENSSAPSYPAAYNGVISVAAVDFNAQRAPYSNFGPTVDLAAPGGNTAANLNGDAFVDGVLSTMFDDTVPPATPVYAFLQGTSMACPHAAGVAALMLALDANLTPTEIESILTSTATDLGSVGRDDLYGHGLIHAERALNAVLGGGSASTPVLGLAPLNLAFGSQSTELFAQVSNLGTGNLDVGSLIISTTSGGPWLLASAVPSGIPGTDTAAIQVGVDRAGLPDGNYTGSIQVQSNGGTQTLQVSMQVESSAAPLDVDLFVLLVDALTYDTVAGAIVNPSLGLDYVLEDLPAGEYLLVCGSDDDNDLFIFGENDLYAGMYPSINEPEILVIAEGDSITNLDFPVTGGAGATPTASGSNPRPLPRLLKNPR